MNDMFVFERTEWELLLDSLKPGSTLSAVRFLKALERDDESCVEQAFEDLLERRITLDISGLPEDFGGGELEKRLRMEASVSGSDRLAEQFDPADPLRLYLEELAAIPAQGDADILASRLLAGEEDCAQQLMNLCLSRALSAACANTGRGVLLLDLIQEASLGLWQGILRYEGGKVEGHLDWWIGQSIARVVTLQARQSGVLQNMQSSMERFRQTDRALLTRLGRNATLEEIAAEMAITPENAAVLQDMLTNASALEKATQMPEPDPVEDGQAVEDTAYFQSRQRIGEMLSTLTPQQAQVLTLRFGLEGGQPQSPQAIAQKLGISPDEVVSIEGQALEMLRQEF